MKVSVIIVNYNVQHFLEVTLHSVQRALKGTEGEIFVVDNASKDGSLQMLASKFPQVQVIANKENVGFSKANNQAFAMAQGEYVLILNPDTVLPEHFFTKTLAYMDSHLQAAALGPRLIDGRGAFAPDGKKSFPTLSVALFKTTGINKVFKRSPYFNKYYAVHIGERQTAPVEVLSGCCMLLRKADVIAAGGAFDEDYFMYCEDVDLSYRLLQSGKQNIYFPEVDVIHYKGESTKKATLSYVRTFNAALKTFVTKHYSASRQRLFTLFINLGLVFRAVWGVLKNVLKTLRMPLTDALVLMVLLMTMHQYWVVGVKQIPDVDANTLLLTFPVYIFIWIFSNYLNGVYDSPYRALRVIRGMLIGTVLNLAYFGLLGAEYRYSRAVVLFTGLSGSIVLVALHELLISLGIYKLTRYNELPKRALIVGDTEHYKETARVLRQVHYAPQLIGRIAVQEPEQALGSVHDLPQLAKTLGTQEIIFCADDMPYEQIISDMECCGTKYEYKIHLSGTHSFVGSNSSHTAGDLYTIDRRYKLSDFTQKRNKRVFDIVMSAVLLILGKFWIWRAKHPVKAAQNLFKILIGKYSFIGYSMPWDAHSGLPVLKPGILPTYTIQENFEPADSIKHMQDEQYAIHYAVGNDWNLVLQNIRYIGG